LAVQVVAEDMHRVVFQDKEQQVKEIMVGLE
jgi:hypothetical protein